MRDSILCFITIVILLMLFSAIVTSLLGIQKIIIFMLLINSTTLLAEHDKMQFRVYYIHNLQHIFTLHIFFLWNGIPH